jgi:aspartyl-tRNA(Asn)/glutamyl-tRNA(Gln) amidotransferase subunit A
MVGGRGGIAALSAAEVAAGVNAGDLSAVEVVEAHVAELDSLSRLNALITPCAERALERARAGVAGPLAGVPLLVKDHFDTEGLRTTYGSSIYADHVPARTARAVSLLEEAGAVTIAKTNLHEFAWGTTSQNPHWGYVGNPRRPGCVAGGSSGGNSAALAAGVGTLSLGSDTGGSIRIPSACCDTVGFKPSHGVVPLDGCFPLSPSFDVAGPMARSVADCALAFSVLSGRPVPEPKLNGLVVGVIDTPPQMSPLDPGAPASGGGPGIKDALPKLEALGARLVDATIEPPEADVVPVFLRECALSHRTTFPSRRDEYGPDTRMKFGLALEVPQSAVAAAYQELPRWRERARASSGPDLYVMPTLAGDVPPIDVFEPDVRMAMVGYARLFSFLGWPAIAIGGLQLAGEDDAVVLAAALAWEDAYGTEVGG